MPAEWSFDASPSAEAILRARDMIRAQARQICEHGIGQPWAEEQDDPFIAFIEGRAVGFVQGPMKEACDALRVASLKLDEALIALEGYAPDHAAEIARVYDIRESVGRSTFS